MALRYLFRGGFVPIIRNKLILSDAQHLHITYVVSILNLSKRYTESEALNCNCKNVLLVLYFIFLLNIQDSENIRF
jgi:hypothetical protein